jgi:hypothetical protein
MKNYIQLTLNKYIEVKLEEYIYNTFLEATEKDKDKLVKKALELYIYLENKSEDDIIQIQATKLKDKWRTTFLKKRNDYTFLLNILEGANLFNRHQSYSTGTDKNEPFTKTIKLTDIREQQNHENIERDFDIQRVYDINELKSKSYWLELYKEQSHIINMIYETYYDMDEVKSYLESRRGTYTKKGRLIDNILIKSYLNRAMKHNYEYNKGERLFNFILTSEGRLYNPITTQPSTIRHLLKHKGEYLVELDIKNSQPLLLSQYINNKEYKEAVENGTFYDILSKELEKDREAVKIMTMKWIFFSKKPLTSGKLYKAMIKHFGNTIEQINELKKDNPLWKILQTAEADIFIKELEGNYISIHDAIMIKRSDMNDFIDKLMVLYQQRQLKPTITING